jgi:hypothetical protein
VSVDVDAAAISGRWYKHARAGAPALERRDPVPDNRWQRGGVVDAIYLAGDEQTVWAEWYRYLAEAGIPPNRALPRDLWEWQLDVRVAHLGDAQRLARVGLAVPRPGRRGWPACQAVGEALAATGWPGLIAPSAARPDALVLCLFRDASGDVPNALPVSPPRRVTDPPAPPTGMTT